MEIWAGGAFLSSSVVWIFSSYSLQQKMIDVRFIVLAARPRITRDDKVSDIALSDSAWSATKEIMDRLQHAFAVRVLKRKIEASNCGQPVSVSICSQTLHTYRLVDERAHTEHSMHNQGKTYFSYVCLILMRSCCFKSCFSYNMPTRFGFLLQVWLPPTTPRGQQCLQGPQGSKWRPG